MPFLPGTTPLRCIVRDEGRAVGYVHCGHIAGVDDPDNLHLLVVVHPDVARRGLGTRLLNEGRAHAIAHGVKGLVASTAGEDEVSAAWARKQGFESAGRLDVCRRESSAGGTAAPDSAPASSALETHVVDQADESAVAELIELAVQTFASVVMPGGGRLIATADNVRALAIGDGNGTLLMCTADGAPVGWLAVSPVQDGEAGLMAAQARPDNAGQDVLDVLVREMALWADRNGVNIAAFVDPDNERDLAKAVLSHGFEQVAYRTIWLGQTTAVGTPASNE
jgi:GNAT superfamily N-acetyltransferase